MSDFPAVTQVTVANTGGSVASSLSFSHTVPAGSNMLVAFVGAWANTGNVPSWTVTYDGTPLDFITQAIGTVTGGGSSGNVVGNYAFKLDDPPVGTHTLEFAPSANRRMTAFAYSVENAGAFRAVESFDLDGHGETQNGGPHSVEVAAEVGDLVIGSTHWFRSAAGVLAWGAGQTGVDDQGVNSQNSRGEASWKMITGADVEDDDFAAWAVVA